MWRWGISSAFCITPRARMEHCCSTGRGKVAPPANFLTTVIPIATHRILRFLGMSKGSNKLYKHCFHILGTTWNYFPSIAFWTPTSWLYQVPFVMGIYFWYKRLLLLLKKLSKLFGYSWFGHGGRRPWSCDRLNCVQRVNWEWRYQLGGNTKGMEMLKGGQGKMGMECGCRGLSM